MEKSPVRQDDSHDPVDASRPKGQWPWPIGQMACGLIALVLSGCGEDDHHGPTPREVTWSPAITAPTYADDQGPIVMVDSAHGNWHTIDFRFRSFADLLRADGYRVLDSDTPISQDVLADADVFVIANAVLGGEDSVWVLPTPTALSPEEVDALERWVHGGGSLLLIADHMPFPASVEHLASAFGFTFYNGYARAGFDQSGTLKFSRDNGLLTEGLAMLGVKADKVGQLKSYTGQGFSIPGGAAPLMLMPDDWRLYLPSDAFLPMTEATPSISTKGLVQGALHVHGDGRVAVFGEAAMFTAQAFERPDGDIIRVGLNDPEAEDNSAFVLAVMHWLSG